MREDAALTGWRPAVESALPARRRSSRTSPLLPLISPLLRSSPRRPAANEHNHQNILKASLHLDSGMVITTAADTAG